MSDEPTLTTDTTLPGARITQVREYAGLSVADLAAAVKVTPTVIIALEADDYDSLPGLPFVRGYLLNVQKALGLSDADIMDPFNRWRAASGKMQTVTVAQPGAMSAPLKEHPARRWIKYLPYVLGFIVVVVLIRVDAVGVIKDWLLPPAATTDTATRALPPIDVETEVDPEFVIEPVAPSLALPDVEVAPLPDDQGLEATAQSVVAVPSATEAAQPAVGQPEAAQAEPAAEPATAAPETAAHRLVMRFSDDSWIEVREAGKLLVGALKSNGESVEFEGDGPFDVLVGSVKATQLVFDGDVLDLTERARQNVARISLP